MVNGTKVINYNENVKILGNYRRLKNIRRCNNFPTIQTEDVAQHSFYVAILAMTLAEEFNEYAEEHNLAVHPYDYENVIQLVDVNEVVKRALFHDMEESFTSDIPYNVKHHSKELNSAMRDCVLDTLNKVYKDSSLHLYKHRTLTLTCKDGLEGKFVAIADLLEGAWYCYQELEMGNVYIRGLFKNYLNEIDKVDFVKTVSKFCPTFNATLNLFRDALLQVNQKTCDEIIV